MSMIAKYRYKHFKGLPIYHDMWLAKNIERWELWEESFDWEQPNGTPFLKEWYLSREWREWTYGR
jgi:hypothetical protein